MRELMPKMNTEMGGCDTAQEPVEARLRRRIENAKSEVADLEKALAALESQPELLNTLNLLRRVGI